MESYLYPLFEWLLRASWQAAVLVLIVLAVQWVLGDRLNARWRHALWLVVVIRLALPFSPESAVSVFNYARLGGEAAPGPAIVATSSERDALARETAPGSEGNPFIELPDASAGEAGVAGRRLDAEARPVSPPPPAEVRSTLFRKENLSLLLGAVWGLGVFVLSLRMVVQNVRFLRRLRRASPIPDDGLLQLFGECRQRYGISARVRLLETGAVNSPAVCGIFRPMILLPAGMTEAFSRDELRAIFLHELAHVKRRDMAVHWLATVLQVLHWFNPFIWYGFRRMAVEREIACDELALSHAREEERKGYGATIIKLLENLPRPAALPGVVGILEDKDQMTRRITMIAKFRSRSRWPLFAVLTVAALAMIGLTDARTSGGDLEGGADQEEAGVTGTDADGHHFLRGRVVDVSGHPLQAAFVRVSSVTRGDTIRFSAHEIDSGAVADDAGEFVIHGREPFEEIGLLAEAPSFARRMFTWLSAGEEMHELVLTKGVSVIGRVIKDGMPLEDVEVGMVQSSRASVTFLGDYSVTTNEQGEFLFENIPPETQFFIYGVMGSLPGGGVVQTKPIRTEADGTVFDAGDLAVEAGYQVEGVVRLTEGPGAIPEGTQVTLSRQNAWGSLASEVDEQGRFRFAEVPPEVVRVSVRIPGYRFSLRNAGLDPSNAFSLVGLITSDKTDLVLELEPGSRNERLSGSENALRSEPLRGAEGPLTSGDVKVTGTVVDAVTGEPLPVFSVTEGRSGPGEDRFDWYETRKTEHTDGTFTTFFAGRGPRPAVLIEAEGYLPYSSGGLTEDETVLAVTLERGRGPEGTVLRPDGQGAAEVQVHLTNMQDGVYISGNPFEVRENLYPGTDRVITDDRGRFSFAPQTDPYSVVVADDAGYAEVKVEELKAVSEIQLLSWARVEGRLVVGTEAGAGETIGLNLLHFPLEHHPRIGPPVQAYLRATTDPEGNFVFDRVPPVPVSVFHIPNVRDRRSGVAIKSQTKRFDAAPGQTHRLTLGGTGRPVIGHLVAPDYEGEIDWRDNVHEMHLIAKRPQPPVPDLTALAEAFSEAIEAAESMEERDAARADYRRRRSEASRLYHAFYNSEEGRAFWFAQRRYALNLFRDGRFRIEDVPAGEYTLSVTIRKSDEEGVRRMFRSAIIASLVTTIYIPESPGGRSDEPYDIGLIELQAPAVDAASAAR